MSVKMSQAIGRRKEAVARVRVTEGNSQISVNGKPISEVFPGVINQKRYQQPLEVIKQLGKYTATIKVEGGGFSSQLAAVVHGLSRSLATLDPEYRISLRQAGLMTRDPRVRERRKTGLGGRARAQKQSPKR